MSLAKHVKAVNVRRDTRTRLRVLRRELDAYREGRETEDLLASVQLADDEASDVRDFLCRPTRSRNYRFMRAV